MNECSGPESLGASLRAPADPDAALREALDAWEKNGAPNRRSLAAFGLTAALAATASPGLDVERLAAAAQNHETSGIHGPLHCSLACGATLAAEYAALAADRETPDAR